MDDKVPGGGTKTRLADPEQAVTSARAVCSANIDSGPFPHTRIWQLQVQQPRQDLITHLAFCFFIFFIFITRWKQLRLCSS